MNVVAVALERSDGWILMQKRRPGGAHGGLWEFPGGKVENGETLEAALVREAREELGIEIAPPSCTFVAAAADGDEATVAPLVLFLYKCARWGGEPQCLDGEEIAWVAPECLAERDTPPLDRQLIAALTQQA